MVSILVRILTCLAGLGLIWRVIRAIQHREMTEANSIFWLVGGCLIVLLGMFPIIISWLASVFRIAWAPAILFFFAVLIIAFILFSLVKQISVLEAKTAELAMQVALLKDELGRSGEKKEG